MSDRMILPIYLLLAHAILIPSFSVNHDAEWNDWKVVNPLSANPHQIVERIKTIRPEQRFCGIGA